MYSPIILSWVSLQKKRHVQAQQNVWFFYMSVQVSISKYGDNYFVLEDAPSQFSFCFSKAPSSAI